MDMANLLVTRTNSWPSSFNLVQPRSKLFNLVYESLGPVPEPGNLSPGQARSTSFMNMANLLVTRTSSWPCSNKLVQPRSTSLTVQPDISSFMDMANLLVTRTNLWPRSYKLDQPRSTLYKLLHGHGQFACHEDKFVAKLV